MLFPNVFIRLFVLIWLAGWLFALVLGGWVLRTKGRDGQRRVQSMEGVAMVLGSFLSWPFLVPFGLWAFVFPGRRRSSRSVCAWWVLAATVLIFVVLVGLIVASVIEVQR